MGIRAAEENLKLYAHDNATEAVDQAVQESQSFS